MGPESFQEKMSRFQGREKEYLEIPELPVFNPAAQKIEELSSAKEKGRTPASISKMVSSEDTDLSNKRLYFLTLYSQFRELSQWSDNHYENINHCPHFHSTILGGKNMANIEYNQKSKMMDKATSSDISKNNLPLFPEVMLPAIKGPEMTSVYKIWGEEKISSKDKKSKILKQAFNWHLQKIESEIKDLCSNGSSDNFYIFENLMTHFGSDSIKQIKPSAGNIGILLRTNIYSNMALITILRDKKSIGPSDYPMSQVYRRIGTNWMGEYYTSIKEERSHQ